MEENLRCWPSFRALLAGYLDRLRILPSAEIEKSWLYRASRSALERPEPAAQLAALELAAYQCDDDAKQALHKKFAGVLPRTPKTYRPKQDDSLLDVIVEVAAYGWLRREYPQGGLGFVSQSRRKRPDIELQLDDIVLAIECKNIHQSEGVRAAFDSGAMISGTSGVREGFVHKLEDTLSRAHTQLQDYDNKMIFLNYTADPDLWVVELTQEEEVKALFEVNRPADSSLVVFQKYDWTQPWFRSDQPFH